MQLPIHVLHIISEKTWRGGENQTALLAKGSEGQARSFFVFRADSVAAQRLAKHYGHHHFSFSPLALLTEIAALCTWIQSKQIQILDCQSSKAHNLGLILKKRLPALKLVVHRRVDYPPSRGYFGRRKYLSPQIDGYVAISTAIAQILLRYGVPQSKVHMVRSAVDSQALRRLSPTRCRSDINAELALAEDRVTIINVAYHTSQKGIPTLIATLGQLKRQQLKFQCLLAGNGPLTAAAKSQAAELGLDDSDLKFLEIRTDVPKLLLAADIFFLPSNFEGLGTSILDAMHAGLPIVASRVGGIPELVSDNHNGFLAAPGDSSQFATHLKLLIADQSLRQKLGQQSQRLARDKFSLEAMIAGNLKVYRQLLQNTKPSS